MPSSRRGLRRTYAATNVSTQVSSVVPPPRPPRQKRARPVKKLPPPTPLETASSAANSSTVSSSETAIMNKDVPPGDCNPSSDEDEPAAKKTRANDIDAALQPRKWGSIQVPPRSPRPVRANRVVNPGAPDKPGTRRTSSQVAAEKHRVATLQRDFEAIKLREIVILAELEHQQELADEQQGQDVVNTLVDSDIEISDPIEDFTNSEFDGHTDVDEVVAPEAPQAVKKVVC